MGRIASIAKMKKRIRLTCVDALSFLDAGSVIWPKKTLIYLDPPYYAKGRDLYYDYYQHDDHVRVARYVAENMSSKKWIVSYDNVPTIRSLYKQHQQIVYRIGYSARESRQGSEAMFFGNTLKMPPLEGPLSLIRRVQPAASTKALGQVGRSVPRLKAQKSK